jgi:hypothetical protein
VEKYIMRNNEMQIFWNIVATLIVLLIAGYIIKLIWERGISFNKVISTVTKQFEKLPINTPIVKPEITYSLECSPINIVPGAEINGVKWGKDFYQYDFLFSSKNVEINDIRIQLHTMGGIVKHELKQKRGVVQFESRTIGASNFYNMVQDKDVDKPPKVVGELPYYDTNLDISCTKISSDGYFLMRIILLDDLKANEGIFANEYIYYDESETKQTHKEYFKILRHDDKTMYIDSTPIDCTKPLPRGLIPKTPIIIEIKRPIDRN